MRIGRDDVLGKPMMGPAELKRTLNRIRNRRRPPDKPEHVNEQSLFGE